MSAFSSSPGTSPQSTNSQAVSGNPYLLRPYPAPDYFATSFNMPNAPLTPIGVPAVFSPMNPSTGPGYPPPLFAHYPQFPQGTPPSPMYSQGMTGVTTRPTPHPPPSPEISYNSQDTRLLRQILQSVSKIGNLLNQTDQTLNDVTVRQSAIEDRLSLMEQRIMRIDSRSLEALDQDRNTNDNVRKAVMDIAHVGDDVRHVVDDVRHVADDVRDIRNLANDNDTQENFEKRMADLVDGSISKCMQQIDTLGEDINEIKKLVRDSAKYALMSSLIAAPPSDRQRIKDAIDLASEHEARSITN